MEKSSVHGHHVYMEKCFEMFAITSCFLIIQVCKKLKMVLKSKESLNKLEYASWEVIQESIVSVA